MHATVAALESAVADWDDRGWPRPAVLVVAGSGLGAKLGGDTDGDTHPVVEASLAEVLPFDVHAVVGHEHRIEILPAPGGHVLYQRGRLHAYQGYDAHQVVFMVRLAGLLGARTLVMSNAAGGIRAGWQPGDLRVISDQINWMGMNPLAAELPAHWGPAFQEMGDAYSPALRALAYRAAARLDIELADGVYAGVLGPSFETPAEVEMLKRAGADLVGMSTVLEVIAARHLGLQCLCFSLVGNAAAGTTDEPVRHEEVLDIGRRAGDRLQRLVWAVVQLLSSRSNESG